MVSVELVDMAFSIDSVLASFGVSEKIWVLFTGGCLGILMMRGVSKQFVKLIEKMPELETTAYVLIAIISLKMIGSSFGFHIHEVLFFSIIFGILLLTVLFSKLKHKQVQV
ncbi:UNVERIFIED_CONTAM: putative tellurium resistance membrane protein TerC [Paenibacillus sp. PvR008]